MSDPKVILRDADNFVMLLTKDFLDGFIVNDIPNKNSVTRIEIDEALKNTKIKFIPVVFPDFSWNNTTNGRNNKQIMYDLWGEKDAQRILGAPPIQFVFQYKDQVIEKILYELDPKGILKQTNAFHSGSNFKLASTPSVIPKRVFCGREEELAQIKKLFESGERIIFLHGIGGIGKTEIAKQYAKRSRDQYDTVIYATYNSSIVELVSSETSFKIEPFFSRKVLSDGTQEGDLSFFKRKLELIRDITNERTLIIIDNFDVTDDEHFTELLDANYRLLIPTRCDYSRFYPTIKVEPLDSMDQLKNLFLQNYKGYFVDEKDTGLPELIELVNRHTYTIELIAQHMENSGQTVDEMVDILKNEGIVSLNEEVRSADRSVVAYENLLRMFRVFNLSDEEKRILQYLSLMPLSGVDIRDFKKWLVLQTLKVVKSLEYRSWIVSGPEGIALHPIIRDVVRYELPLNAADA
ncbi:MAG: ATP-binding protein, partial [Clostridia bacterium]|nr:ATP-binding protein [Clostridia bacterium]